MIYDLISGKIQGTFLNSNYLVTYSEEEFEGIKNSMILYSYSKKMKTSWSPNCLKEFCSQTRPLWAL